MINAYKFPGQLRGNDLGNGDENVWGKEPRMNSGKLPLPLEKLGSGYALAV